MNNIRKVKHLEPKKEPVDNLSAVTFIGTPVNDSKEWLTVNNGANAGQVFYLNPGNNVSNKLLEDEGVEIFTYPGTEISYKGAGGSTCLTRPFLRIK